MSPLSHRDRRPCRPANSRTALHPTNLSANATCTLPRAAHALRIRENVPHAKRAHLLGQYYTYIRIFVAKCETWHVAKANRHPIKAKIQSRDVPPEIFQSVHMDHVKIAVKNATHKYTHALFLIDVNLLCCELIPVKSTSAAEICHAILREWIAHYGVFSELVTDCYTSFTGKLTKMLTDTCGIRHTLISAYHSRSNGQVQHMNELVLQGIRVHCQNMSE